MFLRKKIAFDPNFFTQINVGTQTRFNYATFAVAPAPQILNATAQNPGCDVIDPKPNFTFGSSVLTATVTVVSKCSTFPR